MGSSEDRERRESVELEPIDHDRDADRQPFLPVSSLNGSNGSGTGEIGRAAAGYHARGSAGGSYPRFLGRAKTLVRHLRQIGHKYAVLLVTGLVVLVVLWALDAAGSRRVGTAIASAGGKVTGWSGWSSDPLSSVRERPALANDPLETSACAGTEAVRYGLVIDAGSQGSRIHVYKFNTCAQNAGKTGAMPELEDELFVARKGGLSKYAGRPREAADSLRELMNSALARVPTQLHKCTPVAVKATAGLRLTGEQEAKDILDAVRHMLSTQYPFPLADAPGHNAVEIMDGAEEAVYAWITVNYLLGRIGGAHSSAPTAAVLDLGGASTQIVFEPSALGSSAEAVAMRPGAHVYELPNLAGKAHVLYQNSYLGYGLMQAREATHALSAFLHGLAQARNPLRPSTEGVVPHHCLTRNQVKNVNVTLLPPAAAAAGVGARASLGLRAAEGAHVFQGTANGPDACAAVIQTVLDKHAPCDQGPCAFAGVYQPSLVKSLPAGAPVVALSYFYDRLAPLGLQPTFTVGQLGALVADVCADPATWAARWPRETYPDALKELEDRPESCLDTTFLHTLLKLGYELSDKHVVVTEKKIAGTELGWALGAQLAILERTDIQCRA